MKAAGPLNRPRLPGIAAALLVFGAGAALGIGPADAGFGEDTLHWDGTPSGGFRVNGDVEYIGAARFTPAWPCTVRAVRFYQWQEAENGRIYAWGPGSQHRPGSQLASEVYSGSGGMQWKRKDFDPAPVCPAGTDFWVGVSTEYYNQEYPLGVDRGPMVLYRGGFIKVPSLGETWYQLAESPLYTDRNWNIRAIVVRGTGVEEELAPGGTVDSPAGPTIVRGVLMLPGLGTRPGFHEPKSVMFRAGLFDATGRSVMELRPGANDVSGLRAGAYLLVATENPVRRVVILR